jgi:putative protease
MKEEKIGFVSNYFSKISVAAIEITGGTLSVGDSIHFLGHTTEFESTVHSMQIEHKSVTEAKKGDSVGVKVSEKVREGDKVYKIEFLSDQINLLKISEINVKQGVV